VKVRTKKKQLI